MNTGGRDIGLTEHAGDEVRLALRLDKDQSPLVRLGHAAAQLFKLVAFDGLVVLDADYFLDHV